MGTAPCSMTTRVCSDVPDATLVKAQAASNCTQKKSQSQYYISISYWKIHLHIKLKLQRVPTCSWGRSCLPRNSTNRGTTPALITSSIGGLRSAHKYTECKSTVKNIPGLLPKSKFLGDAVIPIDNNFLNWVVDSNWAVWSSDHTPCTITGMLSSY